MLDIDTTWIIFCTLGVVIGGLVGRWLATKIGGVGAVVFVAVILGVLMLLPFPNGMTRWDVLIRILGR